MASPEKPAPAKFTGAVTLGPQSAVVIMENKLFRTGKGNSAVCG